MIYLDNAATTFPKPESVYKALDEANRYGAVNAGRGSYKLARSASKLISETKQQLRLLVGVDSNVAVVFTPSVTIAINQIVNGLRLNDGSIVYVSPYEHNAVARSVYQLSKKKRLIVKEIPINSNTLEIDMEQLKYEFSKDKPSAVFCTHVSNVTGYILPVAQIFEEAKKYNAITILDSAQSLGLVEVNASMIYADLIAFAGHKTLYGPFGIGGFINVGGINLDVFISGGTGSDSLNLEMPSGSESKYESASSNIVAIAGLNAALSVINVKKNYADEKELTEYLVFKLKEIDGVQLYIPEDNNKHIGIVSFSFDEYNSEELGTILDEDFDIAVRTGYHCAPFIHKYLKDESSLGTVRVGLSRFTTKEDIDLLVNAIKEL